MTNRRSRSGLDDSDGGNESIVIERAKALLCTTEILKPRTFIKELKNLLKISPEAPAILVRLLGNESIENPNLITLALLALTYHKNFPWPQSLKHAEEIAGELQSLIRNSTVTTSRKVTAVDILRSIEHPISHTEIMEYIPGYVEEALCQFEDPNEGAPDSPCVFFDMLRALAIDSGDYNEGRIIPLDRLDSLASIGVSMAENNQAGAVYVGAAIACNADMGMLNQNTDDWLSALEKMGTPRSAWCLGVLADWPMPEAFRDRAREGAARLISAGVKPEPPSIQGTYSRCVLTACNSAGSQSATFFWETPEQYLDALDLVFNDRVGIKNVSYFFGDGDEVDEQYRSDPLIVDTLVEPAFAGKLVADAMARHLTSRTSPPWWLFPMLPYMEGCSIRPAARTPDLGEYALEEIVCTPKLLENSFILADMPQYGCFIPDTDEAYRFCRKFKNMGGLALPPKEFERFVEEVAFQDRETLLHRMALNLEFESLAGRSHDKRNALAARTWLAIRDRAVPFREIPFVRELSRRAIETVLGNIHCGYFNRGEAFEAAQEMENEGFESVFALMDEYGWLDVPPDERILLADDFMDALEGRDPAPKAQSNHTKKKTTRKPKPRSGKGRRRR